MSVPLPDAQLHSSARLICSLVNKYYFSLFSISCAESLLLYTWTLIFSSHEHWYVLHMTMWKKKYNGVLGMRVRCAFCKISLLVMLLMWNTRNTLTACMLHADLIKQPALVNNNSKSGYAFLKHIITWFPVDDRPHMDHGPQSDHAHLRLPRCPRYNSQPRRQHHGQCQHRQRPGSTGHSGDLLWIKHSDCRWGKHTSLHGCHHRPATQAV